METKLSNEDLQFLKDLAHELKTQDNLATRKPVVWRIQDLKRREVSNNHGVWQYYVYKINGRSYEWKTSDEPSEIMKVYEDLKEYYSSQLENTTLSALMSKFMGTIEEWEEYAQEIEDLIGYRVECFYFTESYEFVDHLYFLTGKAAKEHMDKFWYHFKKPRLYCDCSSDTPELEMLLNIVEKFDE